MDFKNEQEAFRKLLEEIQKDYKSFNLQIPSECEKLRSDLDKVSKKNLNKIILNIQEEEALNYIRSDTYNKFKEGYGVATITTKAISIHFKKLAMDKDPYRLPDKIKGKSVHSVELYTLFLGYMGWRGFCSDPTLNINDAILKYPKEDIKSPMRDLEIAKESIERYIESNKSKMRDLTTTCLESVNLKKELYKIMDSIWDNDTFVDSTIPPSGEDLLLKYYFNSIAETIELKPSHIKILNSVLKKIEKKDWQWYDRSLIVSALTISLLKHYQDLKVEYLVDIINDSKKENEPGNDVWHKALIGLILGLINEFHNTQKIQITERILEKVKNNEDIKLGIANIFESIIFFVPESSETIVPLMKEEYLSENYRWFMPIHENAQPFQRAFQIEKEEVNTSLFAKLLTHTIDVSFGDKLYLLLKYPQLKKEQKNELINIFEKEQLVHKNNMYSSQRNSLLFYRIFNSIITPLKYLENYQGTYACLNSSIKEVNELFLITFSDGVQDYSICTNYYSKIGEYNKALEYHQKGAKINPDDYSLLLNWCGDLKRLAEISEAEEAEKLYYQAFEKYNQATKILPNQYNSYYYWGMAIIDLADTKSRKEAEDLYYQAFEKFQKAVDFNLDSSFIYKSWGYSLKKLAKTKDGKEAKHLYAEAFNKNQKANEPNPLLID